MKAARCGQCENCRRGDDYLCLSLPPGGRHAFGGYGQYIARPETAFLPAPASASFEQLACTMHPYSTAINMALSTGHLTSVKRCS
jgi:D-arabinose 1-dehydrogenase-like Zn-dependent alcohol dehydrogenase